LVTTGADYAGDLLQSIKDLSASTVIGNKLDPALMVVIKEALESVDTSKRVRLLLLELWECKWVCATMETNLAATPPRRWDYKICSRKNGGTLGQKLDYLRAAGSRPPRDRPGPPNRQASYLDQPADFTIDTEDEPVLLPKTVLTVFKMVTEGQPTSFSNPIKKRHPMKARYSTAWATFSASSGLLLDPCCSGTTVELPTRLVARRLFGSSGGH